nr:hypothetical protein CFP56_34714 [Quercus suber]
MCASHGREKERSSKGGGRGRERVRYFYLTYPVSQAAKKERQTAHCLTAACARIAVLALARARQSEAPSALFLLPLRLPEDPDSSQLPLHGSESLWFIGTPSHALTTGPYTSPATTVPENPPSGRLASKTRCSTIALEGTGSCDNLRAHGGEGRSFSLPSWDELRVGSAESWRVSCATVDFFGAWYAAVAGLSSGSRGGAAGSGSAGAGAGVGAGVGGVLMSCEFVAVGSGSVGEGLALGAEGCTVSSFLLASGCAGSGLAGSGILLVGAWVAGLASGSRATGTGADAAGAAGGCPVVASFAGAETGGSAGAGAGVAAPGARDRVAAL